MQLRKSHTYFERIYFWTATIHKWLPLLEQDEHKQLVTGFLKGLSDNGFIKVYAFVVMPNHIHLIWSQERMNGKETPKGTLLKYLAHSLLRKVKAEGRSHLYRVNAANKKHEIWQRDSLGIEIYSRSVARQKLEYIHANPVSGKWQLAKDDLSYYYSSAVFYETGMDNFGFLNNLYTVFDGE